jgi:hypothetical protein
MMLPLMAVISGVLVVIFHIALTLILDRPLDAGRADIYYQYVQEKFVIPPTGKVWTFAAILLWIIILDNGLRLCKWLVHREGHKVEDTEKAEWNMKVKKYLWISVFIAGAFLGMLSWFISVFSLMMVILFLGLLYGVVWLIRKVDTPSFFAPMGYHAVIMGIMSIIVGLIGLFTGAGFFYGFANSLVMFLPLLVWIVVAGVILWVILHIVEIVIFIVYDGAIKGSIRLVKSVVEFTGIGLSTEQANSA